MARRMKSEKLNIFLIDDLPHQRYSLKRWIGQVVTRCEFFEAENKKGAKETLGELPLLDLAVIDLELDKNIKTAGLEIVKLLKKGEFSHCYSRVPVIVITVHGDLKEDAYEAGADVFIHKLSDGVDEELKVEVKRLLGL